MDSFGDGLRRVDIGFSGGQAVSARVREDAYKALTDALGSDRAERWHELHSEDAELAIDLSQVVYVRLDAQEARVGFRGA
jgi:RNA binding exosome subunit